MFCMPVGAGLARDGIDAAFLTDRVARIASKPAPTVRVIYKCNACPNARRAASCTDSPSVGWA